MANLSYNEIIKAGRCIDYNLYYACKTPLWIETWRVDNKDYRAIFSDHPNATLPMTITHHDYIK